MIGFCMVWGKLAAQPALPQLFNTNDSIGLYNITMEFSKNTLSGLLILKKTSDSTLRLVLNAEMGPKLLDMELSPKGYKTIYAFKKINRKRILRTFYEDFGALSGILIQNKGFSIDSSQSSLIFTYNLGKQKKIAYSSELSDARIISGKMVDGKSVLTIFHYFYDPATSMISSMKLEHQHFRMVILLNKISL
ncbi:MAG: hypothetical protein Q7U54_03365 [Bacteroidales bacterium]|nr:hypothetical protein [Bacteroidales bacterium]